MICNTNSSLLPVWDISDNNGSNGESMAAHNAAGCVVDYCRKIMDIVRKETCGKCVFCREGSRQVYEIIKDITDGNAKSDDYELLLDILEQIAKGSACEMSRTAALRCMELMEAYEEEWDLHIRRKRCSSLTCKGMYTLYVDPQLCDGCGKCRDVCPKGAIAGGEGLIHIIHPDLCNKSLLCAAACPKGAIKKAGPVKPKLPVEPIPVGSFGTADDSGEGGARRRRRRG